MRLTNLRQVQRAHHDFLKSLDRAVGYALKQGARAAQDAVIADQSFGGQRLRHSVLYRQKKGAKRVIQLYSRRPNAIWIEHGTRPHPIRARRAKFLRFQSGGATHFRKRVYHPGNKATHFLGRATQQGYETMGTVLTRSLRRLAAKF